MFIVDDRIVDIIYIHTYIYIYICMLNTFDCWHHQVQMAEQWMQQSEYGLTDTQRDSLGAPASGISLS